MNTTFLSTFIETYKLAIISFGVMILLAFLLIRLTLSLRTSAEKELAALDEAMAANACDAGRLNELFTQKQETEARLEQEMSRWEELSLAVEES